MVLQAARSNKLLASLKYRSIQKQLSMQHDALQAVLMQVCASRTPKRCHT